MVPLVSASGTTAGGTARGTARRDLLSVLPNGTRRMLLRTTAGPLRFISKGASGTTGSATVVPPGLAAPVPLRGTAAAGCSSALRTVGSTAAVVPLSQR